MQRKTSLAVLFASFVFSSLIAGINFNITKAADYGSSGTTVGGIILENTTWTLENSPYIVLDDVIVEEDVFLTITPGVTIKFANETSLIVRGALVAKGNSTYKIVFTSDETSKQGDHIHFTKWSIGDHNILDWVIVEHTDWRAIYVEECALNITNSILRYNHIAVSASGQSLMVENCAITNVGYGVRATSSSLTITNSTIIYSNYGAVEAKGCTLIIQNCTITNNNRYGVHSEDSTTEIYDSAISYNEKGIEAQGDHLKVYRSTLYNNGKGINGYGRSFFMVESNVSYNVDGIYWLWGAVGSGFFFDMYRSFVSFNSGTGVRVDNIAYVELRIANCTIFGNEQNGIDYTRDIESTKADIHFCNIFKNTPYDVINRSPYGFNVNATYNWWGTANETSIDEHIHDYYDDYTSGKVYYKPYLDQILSNIFPHPIANLTYSPNTPYAYGILAFDASASFNPYGSIVNYTWNFGDGNITTTTSPFITHTYINAANYNVTLTVTDEFKLTNNTSAIITVLEDNIPPITTDNYDGLWHNAAFTITLTTTDLESGVAETYYRINNGPVKTLSIDGQPLITKEGANNTLEYWSVDNAGNEELPHKILTGIKLDKTAPTLEIPSRIPESDVEPNQEVRVSINVADFVSGVKNVTLYYTNDTIWKSVPMTFNTTSALWEAIIPGHTEATQVKYRIEAYDNAGNMAVEDNAGQYYTYTVIPEFPSTFILTVVIALSIFIVALKKRFKPFNNLKSKG